MSDSCLSGHIDADQASALRYHDLKRLAKVKQDLGAHSRDPKGNTPLHLACCPVYLDKVKIRFIDEVLSWCARIDIRNDAGLTAVDLAVLLLPPEAIESIVRRGVFDVANTLSDALHLAANYERADVSAVILKSAKISSDDLIASSRFAYDTRVDRHVTLLRDVPNLVGRFPFLDLTIAEDAKADIETLKVLANSEDRPTLRALASNPSVPTDILFRLAPGFPTSFFHNPVFDWLLLEDPDRILEMGQGVIKKILQLKDCPDSMIHWAIQKGGDGEMLSIIHRKDVRNQWLEAIAEKTKGYVQALAIATNPESTEKSLINLVGIDVGVDRLLAAHPNAGSELLERVSVSSDQVVRQIVSEHPLLPDIVKKRLLPGSLMVHVTEPRRGKRVDRPKAENLLQAIWGRSRDKN